MKQVININFQGRVVPIEVTAFEILKEYTSSLNRHFANEEGKEEIINDIESRIGELFQERLKNGSTCITEDDVNAIIKSMGRPEEFETEENGQPNGNFSQQESASSAGSSAQSAYTATGAKRLYRDEEHKVLGGVCAGLANYFNIDPVIVRIIFVVAFGLAFLPYLILWVAIPSTAASVIGGTRKKLYRDGEDKILAGVCSGIGNYFGVSAWVPRALFLLPFLTFVLRWGHWGYWDFPSFLRIGFSPTAIIIYIILWLVIPEASTTAEKLEMKGEKVDIDSIKNSVMEEMKSVKQRVQKLGKEAAAVASDKSKAFAAEASVAARRSSRSFGDVVVFILKMFAYLIIGSLALSLVIALFVGATAAVGVFPLKDFLIGGDWENAYAWGTLIFFVAVPVVGIITWLVRKLTRSKANSKILTLSFISLWVLGWVCVTMLGYSISREFRYSNKNVAEIDIPLSNPKVNKLELTSVSQVEKFTRNRWLNFSPFEDIDDDTAFIKNYDIKILKSPNDSFRVTMIKMASGSTRALAENNAANIRFSGQQKDTVMLLDKGIAINKTDKFRNQHLVILVYVPVGKHIRVDRSVAWYNNNVHFGTSWEDNEWNYEYNGEAHNWSADIEYEMRADGKLYTLAGVEAGYRDRQERNWDNDEEDDNKKILPAGSDTYRYNNGAQVKVKVDSVKQKTEKEKQRLRDSLIKKATEKIDQQLKQTDNTMDSPDPVTFYRMPGAEPIITIN